MFPDPKRAAHLRDVPRRFIAVGCLVILLVWVVTILTVLQERQNRLQLGKDRAQDLVRIIEEHTLNILGDADTYLKSARREFQRAGSLKDLADFLTDAPPNLEILSHVTVVDGSGKPLFVSNGGMLGPEVSAANRDYFTFQKAATGDQIFVSLPDHGRNSGPLEIRISRRIGVAPGVFNGVIFGSIRLEKLSNVFRTHHQDDFGSVELLGLDKKARAWSVGNGLTPMIDLGGSALWSALETAPTGIITETDAADGITRYLAYKQLDAYPLIASVRVARTDILKTTTYFAVSAISIATLATLVIVLMMAAILRDAHLLDALRQEVVVRRQAEAEAVRATEIKTTFLTTMSHEVRTPINAIMGLFELIENAKDSPRRQKRQAQAGQTAATELFKQLTNVLDASRLEAKALDLNIQDTTLRPVIEDLGELLEAAVSASGKQIASSVTIQGNVPVSVPMDRRRVDQIVLNLIDNAVKFTDAGKIDLTVTTGTDSSAPELWIALSDTGAGIPAQSMARIFDRFSQLDAATSRRARGTGLGLSICKDLAELMHGRLHIKSQDTRGSTFTLILPFDPIVLKTTFGK